MSNCFFLRTACLSNSLLAKAWFSFSILSVSLFLIPMFKLVGPLSILGCTDRVDLFFGAGATELHLPLLISTSLFKRIWLSLLIVIFFSFVRKSFVFFLSSLFLFNWLVTTYASLMAWLDLAMFPIFFAWASISLGLQKRLNIYKQWFSRICLSVDCRIWYLLPSEEFESLALLDILRSIHFSKLNLIY